MNEVEYILRIVLKARDELAGALKRAREELRLFANAADSHKAKIDAFNTSIESMIDNVGDVTDKFKAWRAVMEGTAGENAKARKSFGDLGKEVNETAKSIDRNASAQERAAKAQDRLLKSADSLRNEYIALSKVEKQNDRDRDYTLSRLKYIGQELDRISKKVNDPDIRRFYHNWAQDSKRAADSITADNKRIAESNKQLLKQEEDALARRKKLSEDLRRERDAFTRAEAVRQRLAKGGEFGAFDRDEAELVIKSLRKVATQYEETSKTSRKARVEANQLSDSLRNLGRDVDRTGSRVQKLTNFLDKNKESAASIDNAFRGIGWLAVATFAQQLITVLGGLGGAFVAVAASAAQAGAAIGGSFVAGVAQAMPALGLLGAALLRVKSVMDVVKQAETTRQQQAVQQAGASRRVADATDAIANAQRRLQDSNEDLAKARKEAKKDLEDLIRAEKNAALAAAGAALSVQEAQQALIEAQAGGDTAGIQRAQLALLQAQEDAEESISKKRRARQEAEKGKRGGPEGMEGVTQAKRAVADAQRGLETAKRNADEAAAGTITAAAQLNYLLAQLSPAERRLYDALTNIRNAFKETYRPITDLIIDSFTRSVEGVQRIMLMPDVISMARKTAEQLAGQFNRIFDAFTTGPMIDQFLRIAEEGRKNLKPVADIVISLGKSFMNIAEAGGPALSNLLEFVGDLADDFGRLVGNTDKLEDFFTTGEEHFEAWINLGLAVIELFAALSGAGGAETGLLLVEDATKAIKGLVDEVHENKDDVAAFFSDSRDIVHEVVGVVVALAKELYRAFTPERVKNFSTLLKEVVIPALGDAIEFLGRVTDLLLEIAESPAGKFFLQLAISLFFLHKVFAPLLGVFSRVLKLVDGLIGLFSKVAPYITRFLPFLTRLSTFRLVLLGTGIPALIGAFIFLLDKLGLLDDAWREIKSGFKAFWDEVRPSVEELMESFEDLWKAVSEGEGLFGTLVDVLRPIMKVLISIGGIFLRVFGRTIGRIVGGVIDVLSGFMDFLTGVFTGDWEKAWDGLKKIFRGIWRAVTAPIRMLPDLISEIGKKLLPALRDGAEALWGWLEKLPKRLGNLAVDAANAFVDGFTNVGGDIIKGIISGLGAVGGFARDLANAFIDLLNGLLPDELDIPGPNIKLPRNPIPHIQQGGPIGRGYGGGDRILGLLEAGEHVLTKEEVASMGGHGAVFALRRALGGGGQSRSGRFAEGGEVGAAGTLTVVFAGGGMNEFSVAWREFWEFLQLIARRGSTLVAARFREMRVATTRTMDRMYRDIRGLLADMEKSFDVRSKRIVNSWSDMWMSLKKVAHEGIFYIAHETNQALRGLGEKSINFGLTAPKKSDGGKAGGGWIGSKGHRGRDRGFYPLGDGEAVLNWQHQRYVEPAMNAYYGHGLSDMFARTRGYHAGGPGQPGFATGGFSPIPGYPGEEAATRIIPLIVKLIKQYHAIPTDVYDRDRSAGHKSPGHNVTGTAMDAVPTVASEAGWNAIEAMGRWAVRQGMTVGYGAGVPGSQNWPGHGRYNHIHIELGSNPGAVTAILDMVTKIGRPLVTGPGGGLKTFAQEAIDKVLKAANDYLTQSFEPVSGTTSFNLGPGGPAQKVFDFFTARGLSDAIAAGFVGTFQKESGFNTTITNAAGSGATGLAQWLGGRLTALQQKPNWQSLQTQLNFVWEELLGPESAAFAAIKRARTPEEAAQIIDSQYERSDAILSAPTYARQAYDRFHGTGKPRGEYAEGGIIPGPEGAPVPILAHAREWILNPRQVQRLANMVGVSRDALRSMMGFYGGGPGGFQGGADLGAADIDILTPKMLKGISVRSIRLLIIRLEKIGKSIDEAATGLGNVDVWDTYINRASRNLRRLSRRINRAEGDKNIERGVRGFIESMDKLLGDTGPFAKLRESIERQVGRRARRLQRQQLRVTGPRDDTSVTRGTNIVAIAERALEEEQRQRPQLLDERSDIRRSLRQVRRQQKRKGLSDAAVARLQAEENQLVGMLDESRQRVVDNLDAIASAQEAYDQALIEAQEKKVQVIRDATDKINTAASRTLGGLDLAGRMLDALGRVGLGAVAGVGPQPGISRSGILAARGTALATQQAGLIAQRDRAQALGGAGTPELIDELNDQIDELTVAMQENTKATFDAKVEDVNARAGFALTINDLNKQLTELDGQIAGQVDQQAIANSLTERNNILAGQYVELQALLLEAQGAGNQQAVQDLTIAMLENQIATRQNTLAIEEATGLSKDPQTFTSSAWTQFREAIFTGMGQVLPQYDPANMGGVNSGAVIYPSVTSSSRVSGDTNINLYESGRPPDLTEISAAVTFASKTAQ